MKIKSILFLASILLLTACGAKATPTAVGNVAPIPVTGGTSVTISNYAFSPATLTVKVGTTVTWTNQDTAGHNIIATDNSWGSTKLLSKGSSFSYTFTKVGTYPYRCGVHPEMKATIVVTN